MSRRWGWLALSIVAFAAHGLLRPALQERQQADGLVVPAADAQGLAADVAVPTLALGAFRGMVTDYLWLRSIALKEQGRNYEARQLAEQICRLQPRLSAVWTYLAHDLAYNLAATEDTAEGRWKWIGNGIKLLRDQGLRLNPDDPELYYQLSRIYQDKIGAAFDDFHKQLKSLHATEMGMILGEPPLTPRELNAIPPFEALVAQEPAARELQEELTRLGFGYESLPYFEYELGLQKRQPRAELRAFLDARRPTAIYRRALRSARRDLLVRTYRLDPGRMLEIDRAWGPLEWQGSDAMAIYWALEGMRVAEEKGDVRARLKLRRVAIQALKLSVRRGRVTRLPNGDIFPAPIIELIGPLDDRYQESMRLGLELLRKWKSRPAEADGHGHDRGKDRDAIEAFLTNQHSAREDFLGEAVLLLSQYGRERDARDLLARARSAYPRNPTFALEYDQYVIQALAQRYADPGMFDTQVGISQAIEGAWTTAFKMLALGQDERYRGLNTLARAIQGRWQRYLVTLVEEDAQRLKIPYDAVKRRAAYRAAQQLPPGLRARLAERLGTTLKDLETPPPRVALPTPRGS